MRAYLEDVKDPDKDFSNCTEWFCWAAFERLCARKACAMWLRRVAEVGSEDVREHLLAAARQYAKAYRLYDRFRATVVEGAPERSLEERARTPERIAIIAPVLSRAIEEEAVGIRALEKAASLLE